MEIQSDTNLCTQLFGQALGKMGLSDRGFALQLSGGTARLEQNGSGLFTVNTPFKMGTVLNFIRQYETRHAVESLPEQISIGPYLFEARRSRMLSPDNEILLTDKERDILTHLWLAPGHALDRDNLLAAVWAYADGVETHTLETHIYRLRQKIETDPGAPQWLVNKEGLYKLNA